MKVRGLIPLALGLLLSTAGCRKEAPPQPVGPAVPPRVLPPWSWYPLGPIAVIEGEVEAPTELVLKGKYTLETRAVDLGPVRWELHRPPKDEVATLSTAEGKVLATLHFGETALRATPPKPSLPKPTGTGSEERRPTAQPAPAPARPLPGIAVPEPSAKAPAPPAPRQAARPAPPPVPAPAPEARQARTIPVPPPRPEPRTDGSPAVRPPAPAPEGHWPGSGDGLNLVRGPRSGRQIALTFDGGANAESARDILDVLKARRVRCTFFLTGAFIRAHAALVQRIVREGHEVGNHTLSHPHFAPRFRRDPRWTRERVHQELLGADQLFFRLTGRPMAPLWRAPYGEHTTEIRRWAEELGYRHVGWSEGADTLDWATARERRLYRPGEAILARLRDRMHRSDGEGLVVLMHLGSERPEEDRPVRSLGAFMDRAIREGWSFVAVGDYLRDLGKPDWSAARRMALLDPQASASLGPGR